MPAVDSSARTLSLLVHHSSGLLIVAAANAASLPEGPHRGCQETRPFPRMSHPERCRRRWSPPVPFALAAQKLDLPPSKTTQQRSAGRVRRAPTVEPRSLPGWFASVVSSEAHTLSKPSVHSWCRVTTTRDSRTWFSSLWSEGRDGNAFHDPLMVRTALPTTSPPSRARWASVARSRGNIAPTTIRRSPASK